MNGDQNQLNYNQSTTTKCLTYLKEDTDIRYKQMSIMKFVIPIFDVAVSFLHY